MKLLLDTHVWLWSLTQPERLNELTKIAMADPANDVVLSVASAWEAAIKHAIGKLVLSAQPGALVGALVHDFDAQVLPITVEHAVAAGALVPHHRDPFDRMLVAQAALERMTLVTADEVMRRYGVTVMWAA